MFVYVRIYMCMHACMQPHGCMFVNVYVCMYICICAHACICVCVCVCLSTRIGGLGVWVGQVCVLFVHVHVCVFEY